MIPFSAFSHKKTFRDVDLRGVEPRSEQGSHTLSTRLFQSSFSYGSKTWTTNCRLIL